MTDGTDRISVRDADRDEIEVVRSHRRAAIAEAARYRGGDRLSAADDLLARATGPDGAGSIRLIAMFRSTVLGSLVASETAPGEWMVVHVHVIESGREAGAGDALMGELLRRLEAKGARWLAGRTLPGDREMKNLFERHGLTARLIEVGRRIGGG